MHKSSVMRSGGKACAAGVLAWLSALAFVGSARAGTYVINDCPDAQAGNYNVGPWTQFGSVPGPGSFKQTCTTLGDSFGISSGELSSNGDAGEEIQTPPSITIRRIKLWWEAPEPTSSGGPSYALIDVYSPGWSRIFQAETPVSANGTGQRAPTELSLPSDTSRLQVDIYCTTPQNCDYAENPLKVFGSQLTLADSGIPTGSATGGGLAGAGPVSGRQSLAYDAKDASSGVRLVELLVDGQPVAKNDYFAECPYETFAACPTSVSGIIRWETATASNGTHEVALRVVNAADNALMVNDHSVIIDNGDTQPTQASTIVGPGSPVALRGSANGVNASDKTKLTAHWTTTSRGTLISGYGTRERITGRLTTSAGQPVSGASLDVYSTPTYPGARIRRMTSVRTGAVGQWTLTLPGNVSSCGLRFGYRSHRDDTVAVAATTLRLRVHAGLRLNIVPRTASVGHRVSFSGVVHGAPIPPGGKQLVLEASSGGEWIQFNTTRTDTKGRYHASYRFKFAGPVTYRFRVLSPDEADFPFLSGMSNVVTVHEL